MFSKINSYSLVFLSGHFLAILNLGFHPLSILEVMFQQKHEVVGDSEDFTAFAFTPDGTRVVAGGKGLLKVWRLEIP